MTDAQWLEWRKPLYHIKKYLELTIFQEWTAEELWKKNGVAYTALTSFFDSPEWKKLQFPCLGASEVAVVMGLNPYQSVIELFYEKCGIKPTWDEDNAAMFWGRELEEQIAQKWQYWDGEPETMIDNFNRGNILRKCRRINNYIQNRAFPWLFCSLDRIINKASSRPEGALECKCISGFAANMWQDGIPPMYVTQLQCQLGITEFEFGELAILKDGRYMDVFPFDVSEGIVNAVVEKSRQFYELAKAACAHYLCWLTCPDEQAQARHMDAIDKLAPEPDGSKSYEKYLKDTYTDKGGEVLGGVVQLQLAKDHQFYKKEIERLDTLQTFCSNNLKSFLGTQQKISFGDDGHVTWKADKNGTRSMRFKIKLDEGYTPEALKSVNNSVNN